MLHLAPKRNLGCLTRVRLQQLLAQRFPSLSVCAVFLCGSRQWCGCRSQGFVTCTQVLMHVIAHRCWCMWLHTGADACDCTHGCGRVCTESCQRKKRPLSHEGIKPTSVLHLSFWSSALAMRSCLGVSCTSCGRCFALLAMSSDLQSLIISRSLVVGIWL